MILMRNGVALLCILASVMTGSYVFAAGSYMRDYYSETGVNPYAEYVDQSQNEYIDPFSGSLALSYTDIFVPGNGGMDIQVQRTYNSLQDEYGWTGKGISSVGVGWTIHFGRILLGEYGKLCTDHTDTTTQDNPVVEFPDGSRKRLFYAKPYESFQWITSDRWRGVCLPNSRGILLTSPEGLTYKMTDEQVETDGSTTTLNAFVTTQIKDRRGNEINIKYIKGGAFDTFTLIDKVTARDAGTLDPLATDGRLVNFIYTDVNNDNVTLDKITSYNQVFDYVYEPVPGYGENYKQLTQVIRPDSLSWLYSYNSLLPVGEAGSYSLREVTMPYGGTTLYGYDYVDFDPLFDPYIDPLYDPLVNSHFVIKTTSISTKQTSGRDIAPGLWTYTYSPSSVADAVTGLLHDKTTIVAPNGVTIIEHVSAKEGGARGLYAIGLPLNKYSYDLDGTLIEQVVNQWGFQVISTEENGRNSRPYVIEPETSAPVLLLKDIFRDGTSYKTVYAPLDPLTYGDSFDSYGNPKQIHETGNFERFTDLTYYHQTHGIAEWMIREVDSETIREAGLVNNQLIDSVTTRSYYPVTGQLQQVNSNGVVTSYEYWPTGDLKLVTDPDGFTKGYDDYKRGSAQVEIQKVSDAKNIVTRKVINDTGTVYSITDGRGIDTIFAYDYLNRLQSINYPINSDVSVAYTNSYKSLRRGNLREFSRFDGFGQSTCTSYSDIVTNESFSLSKNYDALGRVVFESYPSSLGCGAGAGTTKEFDILGRVTKITHGTGSFSEFVYASGNQVSVTDERGFTTRYTYMSYGDPDAKWLTKIESPEAITTIIGRNKIGQTINVWQGPDSERGGYIRHYNFDSRYYLESIDNPETGLTVYGRDARGNVTSSQVGSSAISYFTYDGLGRKTLEDYPIGTPDVSYEYDDNSNLKAIDNGASRIDYIYDLNDNLDLEAVSIDAKLFNVDYAINELDQVDSITYPSGRVVDYAPDALGRVSKVGDYVNSISYYPNSAARQMVYANGQVTDYTINQRQWVDGITVGSTSTIVDISYGYDETGNISSITDGVESAYSGAFTYDGMGRLDTANGNWGLGSYVYDELGNITKVILGGGTRKLAYSRSNLLKTTTLPDGNHGYAYDDYGNVTTNDRFNYIYNDANQLTSAERLNASGGSLITNFSYDGKGMRVSRNNNMYYLYASNGNLLGEYDLALTNPKEHIYFGAQRIATIEGNADPVAAISVLPDSIVTEGMVVTLDGTGSSDFDDAISSYQWVQTGGELVALSDATKASPTFTTTTGKVSNKLTFDLTVTDNIGQSNTASVTVSVEILDVDSDGLSDFWEKQYFGDLAQPALGDADNDGYSNEEEFQTGLNPVVPEPLSPFTGLSGIAGNSQTTLFWKPIERSLNYDVYWSTSPGVTKATGTLMSGVSSPVIHSGLTNGTTYYYLVVATNLSAETASSEIKITSGENGWGQISHLDATSGTTSGIFLSELTNQSATLAGYGYDYSTGVEVKWSWINDFSFDSGWSISPATLPSISYNDVSDTNVAFNNNGDAIATWVEIIPNTPPLPPSGEIRASYLDSSTGKWGEALVLAFEEYQRPSPGIPVIDDVGNGMIFWKKPDREIADEYGNLAIEHNGNYITYYDATLDLITGEDKGWDNTTVQLSSQGFSTDVIGFKMAPNGAALAVWRESQPDGVSIVWRIAQYFPGIGWKPSVVVRDSLTYTGGPYGFRVVEIDKNANGLIAWTEKPSDQNYNIYARIIAANGMLEDTKHVATDTLPASVEAALSESGNAIIAWTDVYYDPGFAPFYSYYNPAMGWSTQSSIPGHAFSMIRNPDYSGYDIFPGFSVSIDDRGVAHLLLRDTNYYDAFLADYKYVPGSGMREPTVIGQLVSAYRSYDFFLSQDAGKNMLAAWPDYSATYTSIYTNISGSPRSDAGNNTTMLPDAFASLDGSGSVDLDGTIVSYEWTQIAGPSVVLSDSASQTPSFTTPAVDIASTDVTQLSFELRVTDDNGLSDRDTVSVIVTGELPVAIAGSPQVVDELTTVNLDGSASYSNFRGPNPEGGTIAGYRWRQIDGLLVEMMGSVTASPSFIAPEVTVDTVLTFELTVWDWRLLETTDVVSVTILDVAVVNEVPIADVGMAQTVTEGDTVYLDGNASYDPDGVIVTYAWTQSQGPMVSLTGANTASPSFIAPDVAADTTLGFDLTVTDDTGAKTSASTSVLVQNLVVVDSTPPTTTSVVNIANSKGTDYVDITLSADEPADIYYRISGPATVVYTACATPDVFELYTCTITLEKKNADTVVLEYYGIDLVGNNEVTVTEEIQ